MTSMDHKAETEAVEQVQTNGAETNGVGAPRKRGVMNTLYPGTGFANRQKNHCRRFWWCDLLVIAVIALVTVLPTVYVAIPKKAQNDLNKSTLEVVQQAYTSPRPDQVHVKLVTLAKSTSQYHPDIDAFQAALSIPGNPPFTHLDIPHTKAEAETNIVVDQDTGIADKEQFINYIKLVLSSDEYTVSLDGKTKLHQKGLKAIDVDYNKKVTTKGLNGLKGLNITKAELDSTLPKPYNLKGTVFIPNPSVITVEMGNVTMDLSVDGKSLGQSFIQDLTLKPGDNNLSMMSNVNQSYALNLYTKKYTDGILPLEIVGNSSVINGQHLDYFEAAIRSNVIKLDLNVKPIFASLGLGGGSS